MIGDQALQHFGKPFGWALAADALHADARAFAEEEDLVREELGFREPGLAAQRDEPLAKPALANVRTSEAKATPPSLSVQYMGLMPIRSRASTSRPWGASNRAKANMPRSRASIRAGSPLVCS